MPRTALKIVPSSPPPRRKRGRTPEQERLTNRAAILLRAIERDLAAAEFFTREDLLQLPAFQHVSTISRYGLIRDMIHDLIRTEDVVAMNRTNLVLADHADRYETEPLAERYATVIREITGYQDQPFGVMDIVGRWRTDPHVTLNNKRVAVRGALRRQLREGLIKAVDEYTYRALDAG